MNYRFKTVIGKGGFGKVPLCSMVGVHCAGLEGTEMLRHKAARQGQDHREALGRGGDEGTKAAGTATEPVKATISHSFIVNMEVAFQDIEHLYLVLELMPGGDLRSYLQQTKVLTEEQASKQKVQGHIEFIIACIIIGFEFIHTKGIVHRDLKPENLIIDCEGYIRLADFGIANVVTAGISVDTSGTPGYMGRYLLDKSRSSRSDLETQPRRRCRLFRPRSRRLRTHDAEGNPLSDLSATLQRQEQKGLPGRDLWTPGRNHPHSHPRRLVLRSRRLHQQS